METFILILILCFVVLVIGAIRIIHVCIKKDISGTKVILTGINITLFGGIISLDPTTNLLGLECLITLIGVILSIVGLLKKD